MFRTHALSGTVITGFVATLAACAPRPAPTAVLGVAIHGRTELVQHCQDRDGWNDPLPPAQVFGNVYMVGTCGIVSLLVTSDQGHMLIDGATAEAADSIAANIRTLGFKPTDVKILLSSHEHIDHIGGLAALKMITQPAVGITRINALQPPFTISYVVESIDPTGDSVNGFTGVLALPNYGALAINRRPTDGQYFMTPHTQGASAWWHHSARWHHSAC